MIGLGLPCNPSGGAFDACIEPAAHHVRPCDAGDCEDASDLQVLAECDLVAVCGQHQGRQRQAD